jgi:serine/threonine-protein kinase
MPAVPANQTLCPRCGSAIPAPARFCAACGYAAARLVAGETLDGKYEIVEKIAEGGMGEVYKARHVHLDEIRIIKVTKPDPLGEGRDPRRFQEEARMATLVRHPNVAALYDFSRLPDGSFYMVWEFIDGVTLEEWMRRHGPLPVDQALDVARQVLAGLSEIHAQGIVHRDLSPDNILVRPGRDGRLVAKIIDLGIAKRVAAETLSMTGTGLFVGKLKYCSPEQAGALPEGVPLDGRSDLYSFGVVLYEMLAGRPPFDAQTPEAYLGKHLHASPPPLDTTRLPSRSGPALSAIVRKALEKSREKRFSSAREFAAALDRAAPEATERFTPPPLPAPEKPEKKSVALLLLIGTLVAAAVATSYYIVRRPAARRRLAPVSPVSPTAAPETRPTAAPTSGPDQVIVAPRIIEERTPTGSAPATAALPREPTPGREPARVPTVAPAPSPAPTPPAAAEAPDVSIEGTLTPEKIRRFLRLWETRPIERRATRAMEVANAANFWVTTHPDDPFTPELKRDLPRMMKAQTVAAIDNHQPVYARMFHQAYRQLKFSPLDPELAQRVRQATR